MSDCLLWAIFQKFQKLHFQSIDYVLSSTKMDRDTFWAIFLAEAHLVTLFLGLSFHTDVWAFAFIRTNTYVRSEKHRGAQAKE
jgi:hypothetical protein